MIVLGIDPGLTGGLALIESGERLRVLSAEDIPVIGEDHKRRVHVMALLRFIRTHPPDHAIIERAQAMPDQGASSGFNYGRAVGALEACVQGLMIPLTIIETTAWKRAHGLIKPSDITSKEWLKVVKENSRQRAIMLFPDAPFFSRKLDHGRAEAALIAAYGVQLLTQPATVIAPKGRRKPAEAAQPDLLDRA